MDCLLLKRIAYRASHTCCCNWRRRARGGCADAVRRRTVCEPPFYCRRLSGICLRHSTGGNTYTLIPIRQIISISYPSECIIRTKRRRLSLGKTGDGWLDWCSDSDSREIYRRLLPNRRRSRRRRLCSAGRRRQIGHKMRVRLLTTGANPAVSEA